MLAPRMLSSSSSSSGSDSDLESSGSELLEMLEERNRPKNENYCEHVVPKYNDDEFIEHFRISRGVVESLGQELEASQYFHYQSGGNGKLGSYQQMLIYLWFAGHQTASFRDVADRFCISISTLFKTIRRVTYFLSNIAYCIITWPSAAEQTEIERSFREHNFPGVIGVIDGTHIKIDKPTADPESYMNRKHYFSIQLQAVCDSNRKLRDIFVGFPGSVHVSRVFRASPLSNTLQQQCGHYYLLGDSGYPCLPNLLTPFKDRGHLTRRQSNFNVKLSSNRYIIEHCFGVLKQKFRQLYHLKLRSIPDSVHFIRACCVLHNLAILDDFEYDETMVEQMQLQEVNMGEGEDEDDDNGIQRRHYVCNILGAYIT